jgi:hypothetical protein
MESSAASFDALADGATDGVVDDDATATGAASVSMATGADASAEADGVVLVFVFPHPANNATAAHSNARRTGELEKKRRFTAWTWAWTWTWEWNKAVRSMTEQPSSVARRVVSSRPRLEELMKSFEVITQFGKSLRTLETWIGKAEAHATAKKFDVDILVNERLAPDMYPFVKQVQSACDSAKFAAAYLTGKTAPAHPDTEKTMAECKKRVQTVLAYLETLPESDFAGGDERKVAPPWLQGKWLRGDQYLTQAAIPNFYFHIVTGYGILRHNGVDLGKMDFIGPLPLKD